MDIELSIHCRAWLNDIPEATALARGAARAALAMAPARGAPVRGVLSLAIVLSDDAFLRRLNRDFRGCDETTNVLSFPAAPPIAPDQPCHLGDIAIAHQTVLAEAAARAITPADHLAHMVVHGVLHLLGYDHMTPGEAALMEPLEGVILRRLGIADPYGDDDRPDTRSPAGRP